VNDRAHAQPEEPELIGRDQLVDWFVAAEKKRGQLIGTEQEKFGLVADENGELVPLNYEDHVRPLLEALASRFGWKESAQRGVDGELIALERDGASITLEPGGQIELSGAPLPTVHATCAEFTQHYGELHAVATDLRLTFLCCGFHPFATHEQINWMPKGRYAVMRSYLPTRGSRALDMMVRTCTIQTNLDFADEAQCGRRVKITMGISSLITAMFSNSPYIEGRGTEFKSNRAAVWEDVDPDRTGLLRWVFEEGFSYERYVDWALKVPMFFVKRGGNYFTHHATFAEYMRDGFADPTGKRHRATHADWQLHLNTLFPEVRLNPFIEIRAPDSVGSRHVCGLPALCKGLFYDDDSRDAAWELIRGLNFEERLELAGEARIHALSSPRIQDTCRTLVKLAREGLERLDVRDSKGRTEARFLDSLQASVDAGRCPGDDAVLALGENPGTDADARRAYARHFYFAGVEV
jgi:glutamate--cysteine ligase